MMPKNRQFFQKTVLQGAACGLAAAVLFGLSSPLAKLLLQESDPVPLAALLYLGAGTGLVLFGRLVPGSVAVNRFRDETPVKREDVGFLLGLLMTGGVLGPILLLVGLQRLSAVAGSLLLNLEAPFTILLAVGLFQEHLGRREMGAVFLIVIGASVLSYQPDGFWMESLGAGALAAACLCWAIDNNLTQRLSLHNPIAIVRVKALGAGACSLIIAFLLGQKIPPPLVLIAALAIGFLSYGISVVLDVYALRLLGAAREAGFFAVAPFVGAVTAVPILGEQWTAKTTLAGFLMAFGVVVLLSERHAHHHVHDEMEHDHRHAHTDHHQHQHEGIEEVGSHAHRHRHDPLAHDHPHVSEIHHRHEHQ